MPSSGDEETMDETEDLREFELASADVLERLSEAEPNGSWIVTRDRGDGPSVVLFASTGSTVEAGMRVSRLPVDDGYWSATDFEVQVTRGASADEKTFAAVITAPITAGDRRFGVLAGLLTDPFGDPANDRLAIRLMADLISRVLSAELELVNEQRLRIRAAEQALTDPMTGAGNRRAWEFAIDQEERRCRRYGHEACILIVDLDDLKECNDTFGHAAGDALIERVVEILDGLARDVDTVARLGGDEFGVLMAETPMHGAEHLEQRVATAFTAEQIPASIGLACRNPSVGLIGAWQAADAEMYRMKHRHHGRTSVVTHDRPAG